MRFLRWINREILHLLPAFLFFFITLNLVNMTEGLMLKHHGIAPFSFVTVLVAACVVAKVLLIIDHLPIINAFKKRPLIYPILWKTFLYSLATLIFRFLFLLIPFLIENPKATLFVFFQDLEIAQFIAIQLWYVMLFLGFVTSRELILVIGSHKVRKLFFG